MIIRYSIGRSDGVADEKRRLISVGVKEVL